MIRKYPFLISVPHGGKEVPAAVRGRLSLSGPEIRYYGDPATRELFGFRKHAAEYIETRISRMVIDLNRPPLPLPGKDPDGIVKRMTIDGKEVYRPGKFPPMPLIHRLMMDHYFPYHQEIDELIDHGTVEIAFDCHSMLPFGSCGQNDAGKMRPLICLSNNGDRAGRAKKGSIATCPQEMIQALARSFAGAFGMPQGSVAINTPFSGGFIANAHYWRKGIPWVQVEVNRSLYEDGEGTGPRSPDPARVRKVQGIVWKALTGFWDACC